MCTSIAFFEQKLFGRNLDLEVSFGQRVVIVPRSLAFPFAHRPALTEHYAIVGMASVAGGLPLFAEGMNEKGLYMAGLNFPGNAHYFADEGADPHHLAPHELLWLVLGSCASLAEARALLEGVTVCAIPFAPGLPLAPLHWHVADATGALVAESTADGLHLYEDKAGVLTNNPPFPFHQTNLANYMNLSPRQPENQFAPGLPLACFGQGMGAIGLPGDASPASRYVRAVFFKENAGFPEDRPGQVMVFFHVLEGVAMVQGSVVTPEGALDETLYSSCIDGVEHVYYWRTAGASRISAVRMTEEACRGGKLLAVTPEDTPAFAFTEPQPLA